MYDEMQPDDTRREPSLEQKHCLETYIPKRITKLILTNIQIRVSTAHVPINFFPEKTPTIDSVSPEISEKLGLLPGISLNLGHIEFEFTVPMYSHILIPMLSAYNFFKDVPKNLLENCYNKFDGIAKDLKVQLNMMNIIDGSIHSNEFTVINSVDEIKFDGEKLLMENFWTPSKSKHQIREYQLDLRRTRFNFSFPMLKIGVTYPIIQYLWRFLGTYLWHDYAELGQFHEVLIRQRVLSEDFADKFGFELSKLHGSFYQDGKLHSGMFGIDGLKAHVTPHNNPNRVMPIFEGPIFDDGVEKVTFFTRPELSRARAEDFDINGFLRFSYQLEKNDESRRFMYLNVNPFSVAIATRLLKVLKRNLFALELRQFFKNPKIESTEPE
jgi:hypothetical protein